MTQLTASSSQPIATPSENTQALKASYRLAIQTTIEGAASLTIEQTLELFLALCCFFAQ